MFFFFKQKTAYEMRISDWSSDVCSSDLSLRYRSRETKRSSWFSADRSRSPEPAPPLITAFDAMLSKARTRSSPGTVISAINACDGNKPRTSGCLSARLCHRPVPLIQSRPPSINGDHPPINPRSEEHTSELQSLMRISYAVFCLKKKTIQNNYTTDLVK